MKIKFYYHPENTEGGTTPTTEPTPAPNENTIIENATSEEMLKELQTQVQELKEQLETANNQLSDARSNNLHLAMKIQGNSPKELSAEDAIRTLPLYRDIMKDFTAGGSYNRT